jgi:2-polyprenyl-3-methyl-5-hydroxy-6-metoxy-1,4-benzoquinol methylase
MLDHQTINSKNKNTYQKKNLKVCTFCKKNNSTVFYALRSNYFQCNLCKTIINSGKRKINIFNFFYNTPLRVFSHFYKNKSNQFYYYKNSTKTNIKNEKYKFLYNYLKKNKTSKKILDISGGPGNVAFNLKNNLDIQVSITEYNKNIVNKIKRSFNLKTYYFDFDNLNKNNLPRNQKYDLIVLWNCIYYCKKLRNLIKFLSHQIKKKGEIIIAKPLPNFATITKFSIMENYAPYRYYSPNILTNEINKISFYKKNLYNLKGKNFIIHYFFNFQLSKKLIYNLICILISIYYIFRNLNKINLLKDLKLEDFIIIYKKNNLRKIR